MNDDLLTGHPDLAGLLSGFSLVADWAAPAPTPNPNPEAPTSLPDLTARVNLLLRAQALTLAALAELVAALRATQEGGRP